MLGVGCIEMLKVREESSAGLPMVRRGTTRAITAYPIMSCDSLNGTNVPKHWAYRTTCCWTRRTGPPYRAAYLLAVCAA